MGKLAVIKTKVNAASVTDFINSIPDEQQRKDSTIIPLCETCSLASLF